MRTHRSRPPTLYEEVNAGADFQELRRRLRRFVFPMSAAFLLWYLLYVLLASYAPAFMGIKVAGNINLGLLMGLLQFVSTFAITMLYVRYAARRLDPLAADLRVRIESAVEAGERREQAAVVGVGPSPEEWAT